MFGLDAGLLIEVETNITVSLRPSPNVSETRILASRP